MIRFPWTYRRSIDLIFIHIHKTGGKSISKILGEIYAESHFRINRSYLRRHGMPFLTAKSKEIPRSTKVLSGHLTYEEVRRAAHDKTKWVTWLRHPVDRVISNYFWRLKIDHANSLKTGQDQQRQMSIESFIENPENQNWMAMFLTGINIKDFFHIGFLETFNDDIDLLGQKLNWKDVPKYHINKNINFKPPNPDIDTNIKKRIEDLNTEDMRLYHEALKNRK
jgi:hypothetical protein